MPSFDIKDPWMLSLGWNENFQKSYAETDLSEFLVARVMGQGKGHYHLQVAPETSLEAAITTKFHDSVSEAGEFPTVGDWVTYKLGVENRQATIHRLLRRRNLLQRRKAGAPQNMQLIAANVDHMCVVTSCNEDFDLGRLGRYIAMTKESEIEPIILLTKTDIVEHPDHYIEKLKTKFKAIRIFSLSSQVPESTEQLRELFATGLTTVLLGSSGVGKSTLTNDLLGFSSQKTQTLSNDSRGRHTTTARNLRFTRFGGIVIDTPGMQEIAEEPMGEDEVQKEFADLQELALRCKFTNCHHDREPGCAIQNALKDGVITAARWDAYTNRAKAPSRVRPAHKK